MCSPCHFFFQFPIRKIFLNLLFSKFLFVLLPWVSMTMYFILSLFFLFINIALPLILTAQWLLTFNSAVGVIISRFFCFSLHPHARPQTSIFIQQLSKALYLWRLVDAIQSLKMLQLLQAFRWVQQASEKPHHLDCHPDPCPDSAAFIE